MCVRLKLPRIAFGFPYQEEMKEDLPHFMQTHFLFLGDKYLIDTCECLINNCEKCIIRKGLLNVSIECYLIISMIKVKLMEEYIFNLLFSTATLIR